MNPGKSLLFRSATAPAQRPGTPAPSTPAPGSRARGDLAVRPEHVPVPHRGTPLNDQFRTLVHALEALRIPPETDSMNALPPDAQEPHGPTLPQLDRGGIIQITSAVPGEGVSTIASGGALKAADERRDPVLLLDCAVLGAPERRGTNNYQGAFEAFCGGNTDMRAFARQTTDWLYTAPLAHTRVPLLGAGRDSILAFFERLRTQFPLIFLDTPPILTTPQSASIARYCDGTILVVRAESTPREQIRKATALISERGGQPLGIVLNHERQYLPRFLQR